MAIFSMTGFGEGRAEANGVAVTVEAKSVNHRFLDVVFRLPSSYSRFEQDLARAVKANLKRGRIEVSVSRGDSGDPAFALHFNKDLFGKYLAVYREGFALAATPEAAAIGSAVVTILNKREVLEMAPVEASIDSEQSLVLDAVTAAIHNLISMRAREGAELENELNQQLTTLETTVRTVQEKVASAPVDFKARLMAKLERVSPGMELDPERLAQEVALLAERVDVTEELIRLQSHFLQFRKILSEAEGGRKLEFLLQEFGREINTIGSKAQNGDVTSLVIEAKSIVEKLREQVANIE